MALWILLALVGFLVLRGAWRLVRRLLPLALVAAALIWAVGPHHPIPRVASSAPATPSGTLAALERAASHPALLTHRATWIRLWPHAARSIHRLVQRADALEQTQLARLGPSPGVHP